MRILGQLIKYIAIVYFLILGTLLGLIGLTSAAIQAAHP